jgi:WD40 repeat protein
MFDFIQNKIDHPLFEKELPNLEKEFDELQASRLELQSKSSQKIEVSPDFSKILLQSMSIEAFIFLSDYLFTRKPFCFSNQMPNYGHSRFSRCGSFLATSPVKGTIQIFQFSEHSLDNERFSFFENRDSDDDLDLLDDCFVKSFNVSKDNSLSSSKKMESRWYDLWVSTNYAIIENAHVLDINDFAFCPDQQQKFVLSVSDDKMAHFWKLNN